MNRRHLITTLASIASCAALAAVSALPATALGAQVIEQQITVVRPAGALVLTAAVDTQNDRLEFKVVGWGPGLEGWVVDYQVIMGSPAEQTTWARLDELLLVSRRQLAGVREVMVG